MPDALTIAKRLLADMVIEDDFVVLALPEFRLEIRSNSQQLLDRLRRYFAHATDEARTDVKADVVVHAIEGPPVDLGLDFIHWQREPGKSGRKDAYHDLSDGRLIRKVRTGMLFLQSEGDRIARGPCVANDNQIINFVNCQYMNWLQRRGALICHASCVVFGEQGLAIAGFSGGGKSSLMLRLLEEHGGQFLTNDRLLLGSTPDGEARAIGIPKLPRVNPGTILSLPSLRPMFDQPTRGKFESLPTEELWTLEQKYDVDVTAVYGDDRIVFQSRLTDLLVLNWQRNSDSECQIKQVNLRERPELLKAITKTPGPFYSDRNGVFQTDDLRDDHRPYLRRLEHVNVWEASGTLDFAFAAQRCLERLRTDRCTKTS